MAQQRRPTLLDVARMTGVSAKTVSRVVNDEGNVQADTAKRILEAVAALGYRRNRVAVELRTGRHTTYIGLVIDDLENPFYSRIARGVEDEVRERGGMLVIGSSEEDADRERVLVEQLIERRVDGLLVVPAGHGNQTYLVREIGLGTAVVCLDRPPRGVRTDLVLIDNAGGARSAVAHLAAAGCRRIAMISDSLKIFTMRERLAGFEKGMGDAGLRVVSDLVAHDVHTPEQAAATIRGMRALRHPPDGILCANNRLTVGVVTELAREPADIHVVGFDAMELASSVPVSLALVSSDEREMGRQAARLLFRRLDEPTGRRQKVVLPTVLVTSGAPQHFPSG